MPSSLPVVQFVLPYFALNGFEFCRNYFYDFSKRILLNWKILYEQGYSFNNGLEFPDLDFSSTYPDGSPCSFLENRDDPAFVELPAFSADFDSTLELVASQIWGEKKKKALRTFFRTRQVQQGAGKTSLGYDYLDTIVSVLHYLKEEVNKGTGFDNLPIFQLGHLRTTDPAEIDPVITLHNVMSSYVSKDSVLPVRASLLPLSRWLVRFPNIMKAVPSIFLSII